MIPFGSQRGEGPDDLGPHLENERDNLEAEVMQVRGAVARDVRGAFAEWEAQAYALTKCANYLYSLSINPDQRQGRWTKEMYFEYIERAESRLNLAGQPRVVVRHVKEDERGIPREHYHCVWSRIDVQQRKARHIAYDHDTLMMVTRAFARDHDLRLPAGYDKGLAVGRKSRNYQMPLYDRQQENLGGLPLEQHRAQVTAAWERRDTPQSFVRSLEDMGYILATGRKDYVLVDRYGHMKALPRLIDDKKVRVQTLRDFFGKEYPTDSLPTVEEARALAAAHRAAVELFRKEEERAARDAVEKQRREDLRRQQQPRRAAALREATALSVRQRSARQEFSQTQKQSRMAFRHGYLQESRRIKTDRAAHRPQGLAAFIGRITGVELVTKKIHQYRDAARYRLFLAQKAELAERQQRDERTFDRRQELERAKMERRLRAIELIEKRELRSLETTFVKERRIEDREQTSRAPSPPEPMREPTPPQADVVRKEPGKAIDLKAVFGQAGAKHAPGYLDQFNKAAEKETDLTAAFRQACADAAQAEPAPDPADAFYRAAKKPIDLTAEFAAASGSGDGEGEASGDAAQNPAPEAEIKIQRRRKRDRTPEAERPMRTRRRDGGTDNEATPSDDPTPRRRRNRDPDRGR